MCPTGLPPPFLSSRGAVRRTTTGTWDSISRGNSGDETVRDPNGRDNRGNMRNDCRRMRRRRRHIAKPIACADASTDAHSYTDADTNADTNTDADPYADADPHAN